MAGINSVLAPMGVGGNGSIAGTVYDKLTNAPLAGVKVMAGCYGHSALTGIGFRLMPANHALNQTESQAFNSLLATGGSC